MESNRGSIRLDPSVTFVQDLCNVVTITRVRVTLQESIWWSENRWENGC